jgi:hypothetical protein
MKAPLTFARGNLLFGSGPDDAWALYRVATTAYAGLGLAAKRDVLGAIAGFAFSVEADFQLLRVTRPWSPQSYREAARAGADLRHSDGERLDAYLAQHEAYLDGRRACRPELFVAVALQRATANSGHGLRGWLAPLQTSLGLRDARAISRRRLGELQADERRIFGCIGDYLDCERASTDELQWLVKRAFSRGVGEPEIDRFWQPQALVVDAPEHDGGEALQPLESDLLRLSEDVIDVGARRLRVDGEAGVSH